MFNEILLREGRLKKLDKGEVRLLFWLCKGKTLQELAENEELKLDVSIKTLRGRLTEIYKKTELARLEDEEKRITLRKDYCSIVDRVLPKEEDIDLWIEGVGIEGRFTEPEEKEKEEPIPVDKDSPFIKQEKKPKLAEPDEAERLIRLAEEQQRRAAEERQRTRRVISILFGVLVIAIIIIIIMWLSRGCQIAPPQPELIPPTSTLPVEFRLTQTYLAREEPTIVVDIFGPADTPTPSPIPKQSPTPTRTPIPLPFVDEFDKGYREEWIVIGSDPIISEGRLSTDGSTWLFLGNEGWTDYLIEFIVYGADFNSNNEISVRVQDITNRFSFRFYRPTQWEMTNDGVFESLTDTDSLVFRSGTPGHADEGMLASQTGLGPHQWFITVEGNYLETYAYPGKYSNWDYGTLGLGVAIPASLQDEFSSGGIGFKLAPRVQLLSVRIYPVP